MVRMTRLRSVARPGPSPRLRAIAALLGCLLLVAGCSSSGGDGDDVSQPTPEAEPLARGEAMELDVFVFNIEYGGDETTDRVIEEIDADIVGVLESYNRLPEIAERTGYPYYNVGLQLLSKYPIHEPSGADGLYSLIEVQPGHVVAFFNTHLDYVKYGPALLVNGMPLEEVLASENEVRTASMEILTPDMAELVDQGYPVFLTGDFNTPSDLDYTEETVGTRKGITEPVPWPVTELLHGVGMRDTYREVHPDPVKVPGLTKDNPDFRSGGFGDRIDYVFAGGSATMLDSKLVGERGGPDVEIEFEPWTSDHRAILSTFELTPVALRTTVALDRRMLTQGEELIVTYNAPDHEETSVAVLPEGGDVSQAATTESGATSGEITVDTGELEPDGYDIVLLDADGEEVARNSFWVRSVEADVVIETGQDTYGVGEPIDISWDDGPANRWDWIGVYRSSSADPRKDDYLLWGYTGDHESGALPPQVFGGMTLSADSQGQPWPLPPGDYRIHYLLTDRYRSAGFVDITVVE